MTDLDNFETKYHIVTLPDTADLEVIRKWLNENIGNEYDVINIEIIYDENGNLENYRSIFHWMWLQPDCYLNNLVPSNRIGFNRKKDAIYCKLVWG